MSTEIFILLINGMIQAYNINNISNDENPEKDIVFSSPGGSPNNEHPVALGKGRNVCLGGRQDKQDKF